MLKGHVEIDLHNHNSGFTERIEQDNLVTDAIAQLTDFVIGRGLDISNVMPINSVALGGLMIFEDPITESAMNVQFPHNNALIGYAGQSLNSDDKERGSINTTESGPITNGFMTVWDFSTSQANGYISSMARTHYKVENDNPEMAAAIVSQGYSTDSNLIPLYYENNNIYCIDYSANPNTLRKMYYPIRNFLLTDPKNYSELPVVVEENVFNVDKYWIDGDNGYFYCLSNISNNYLAPNSQEKIGIKYTFSTVNKMSHVSGQDVVVNINTGDPTNKFHTSVNFYDNYTVVISGGYLYVTSKDDSRREVYIFIIDLSSYTTPIVETEPSVTLSYDVLYDSTKYLPLENNAFNLVQIKRGNNGTVVMSSQLQSRTTVNIRYHRYTVINSDGTYKIFDRLADGSKGDNWPMVSIDNNIVTFNWNYSKGPQILASYLGTICNLDVPFEKTNTSSMKVKYTLTNV